jgi:hypothetical protein
VSMRRAEPIKPKARRWGAGEKQHMDGPIQVRVERVGQLFHTLDPLPFRERDLDAAVEEYVVGWAGEIAARRPISIIVHLPAAEARLSEAGHIEEAMRNYFVYRAEVLGWDLRDLFWTGRTSLAGACHVHCRRKIRERHRGHGIPGALLRRRAHHSGVGGELAPRGNPPL